MLGSIDCGLQLLFKFALSQPKIELFNLQLGLAGTTHLARLLTFGTYNLNTFDFLTHHITSEH